MNRIFHALNVLALGILLLFCSVERPQAQEAATTPDTLTSLLETLKDEDARNALIAELETLTAQDTDATEAEPTAEPTVADRMADFTASTVESVVAVSQQLYTDISRIGLVFTTGDADNRRTAIAEGTALLATIVATSFIFLSLYRILKRVVVTRRVDRHARLSAKFVTLFLHFVVGVISLIAAYLFGYALAYFVFGEAGLDDTQALYLNAFLVVGVFGILIKLVVSGDPDDVTVSDLPAPAQAKILHRVRLVFGVAAYGIMAVAPIVQSWTNFLVGRSVRAIVVVLAVLLAFQAIRAIKRAIDRAHAQEIVDDDTPQRRVIWPIVWPWFAVVYVLTCFVIAVTRQSQMVELIAIGTLYTVGAAAVFLIAGRIMGAVGSFSLPILPSVEGLLPGLTGRLSSLAVPVMVFLSIALVAFGVGLLLTGWTSFNVFAWLGAQSEWSQGIINATLLVLFFILVWAVVASWIDNRLTLDLPGRNVSARTRTLLALFRNAFTIAIVIIGIMMVLSEIGINIAPLLAGAGVLGLAIGFGAQKLVQDIITGIFIQLENAINEGDVVTVAGITGGVEKLTIRSVSLRSLDGQFHIIPFNSVDTVSNYMRRFAFHVAEIGVAYGEQVPEVKDAMLEAFRRLEETEHKDAILEPFEMHGVTALGDSAVVVRGRIKTKPGSQWAVGRAYTEIAKAVLDERGIEIPFPHRELKLPKELLEHFTGKSVKPAD